MHTGPVHTHNHMIPRANFQSHVHNHVQNLTYLLSYTRQRHRGQRRPVSAPGPGFLSPERGSALSVPLIDSDSGVYLARLSCPHGRISIIGRDPLPSPPLQPRGPPLGESKALRKLQQLRECSHCEVPIQNTKYTNTKHQGLGDSYVTSYMLNNPLSGQ